MLIEMPENIGLVLYKQLNAHFTRKLEVDNSRPTKYQACEIGVGERITKHIYEMPVGTIFFYRDIADDLGIRKQQVSGKLADLVKSGLIERLPNRGRYKRVEQNHIKLAAI